MTEDTLLSVRYHAIPGALESHPSPADALSLQGSAHPSRMRSLSPQRARHSSELSSPCYSPPSSLIANSLFPVHLRGGAGRGGAGLSDILMPAKRTTSKLSKEEIEAAKKLLDQKMGRWDCWAVGYQPKKGQTWKGFTKYVVLFSSLLFDFL